jgi:hypothetical protein
MKQCMGNKSQYIGCKCELYSLRRFRADSSFEGEELRLRPRSWRSLASGGGGDEVGDVGTKRPTTVAFDEGGFSDGEWGTWNWSCFWLSKGGGESGGVCGRIAGINGVFVLLSGWSCDWGTWRIDPCVSKGGGESGGVRGIILGITDTFECCGSSSGSDWDWETLWGNVL